MAHTRLLSVVIVARNEEKNIERCIKSILNSTASVSDTEILLVDSSSIDNTVEIASKYPISIIRLPANWQLSPAAGRFTGVNNVSGEFVLIIDGDMELLQGWAHKAISFFQLNEKVAAVVGRHYDVYYAKDGTLTDPTISRNSLGKNSILKESYVYESSIFRRCHLLEVGNFHPFLRAEEEAEISDRLVNKGFELYSLPFDSIKHYSLPRRSLGETLRRIRLHLWIGIGDMVSWCFWRGRFEIIWKRCKIYFLCGLLDILAIMGIFLIIFRNYNTGIYLATLPLLFWFLLVIKKGGVREGTLSFININVIMFFVLSGIFHHIPDIDKYPQDFIWIKKGRINSENSSYK